MPDTDRPSPEPQPGPVEKLSERPPFDAPGLTADERTAYFLSDWFATSEESLNLAPNPIKLDRLIAAVRRDALEEAAKLAQDYERALPMSDSAELNEATDDPACEACRQVAAAIRALAAEPGEEGKPTHRHRKDGF